MTEEPSRKVSWWCAFACVITMTVSLIGSLFYEERWLGIALVASFFAPFFMLGIKMGTGDP